MDINSVALTTETASGTVEREPTSQEMSEFLRLLTAQIKNQDPLEPLEANQFIEQLATINSLEQQIQSNEYLAEILSALREGEDTA